MGPNTRAAIARMMSISQIMGLRDRHEAREFLEPESKDANAHDRLPSDKPLFSSSHQFWTRTSPGNSEAVCSILITRNRWPSGAISKGRTPECAGVAGTERQAPLANGLVSDRNAPLGQQVLDIVPETDSEAVIVTCPPGLSQFL